MEDSDGSDCSVQQDEQYYFPDGNLTILVSDTLFRVHDYVLSRDGSAFADMFAVDKQGSVVATPSFVQDGQDDEHPIELQGDTVEQFRDLLWTLYSLPHEIVEVTSPKTEAHVIKLTNIASIAHKYHFSSIESWTLQSLVSFFNSYPPPSVSLSTDTLMRITEVAVLCQDDEKKTDSLLAALRPRWAALIAARQDLGLIVTTMERLGIRDLCGTAYVAMLLQGREVWEKDPYLTHAHRIRLLSGYYNLSMLVDELQDNAPLFAHHPYCTYPVQDACVASWYNFWKGLLTFDRNLIFTAIPRPHRLDVLARLTVAEDFMKLILQERVLVANRPRHVFEDSVLCHPFAFHSVRTLYMRTQNQLMDLFNDPV